MPDFSDSELTIRFERLGRDVTLKKNWSIESSYLTPTDGFDFTLYDTDLSKLRRLELQPVNLLVNGNSQCLGRVEATTRGNDGTAIGCRGRDYFSAFTECQVDPTLLIKKEMTLETVLKMTLGVCGISNVITDDDFAMREIRTGRKIRTKGKQVKRHKKPLNEYKPQPGEGLFAFNNRIVARMGGTIQPANARDTVIVTAPRYDQDASYSITRLIDGPPGERNLVISGTATRDFTSFPTYILVAGKMVTIGETHAPTYSKLTTIPYKPTDNGWQIPYRVLDDEQTTRQKQLDVRASTTALAKVLSRELAEILGASIASVRRLPSDPPATPELLYRLLYLKDADSGDQEQLDRVAVRAFAQKFKDTLTYSVTLRGHVDPLTGAVWATDTIVKVTDEVCDIDENLWIMSRRFAFQDGQGATTTLECIRPGAFQIDTNEDVQ